MTRTRWTWLVVVCPVILAVVLGVLLGERQAAADERRDEHLRVPEGASVTVGVDWESQPALGQVQWVFGTFVAETDRGVIVDEEGQVTRRTWIPRERVVLLQLGDARTR